MADCHPNRRRCRFVSNVLAKAAAFVHDWLGRIARSGLRGEALLHDDLRDSRRWLLRRENSHSRKHWISRWRSDFSLAVTRQINVRITFGEIGQPGHQPFGGERWRDAAIYRAR